MSKVSANRSFAGSVATGLSRVLSAFTPLWVSRTITRPSVDSRRFDGEGMQGAG